MIKQIKHPFVLIRRQAYWSYVKNVDSDPSQALAVRGNVHLRRNKWGNTRALYIERMAVCAILFYLCFYHSPSLPSLPRLSVVFFFFCSVEFSQLFQSFLLPGDSDLEKQCLFLFLFRNSRLLPLCCNANLCLSRKKTAQWQMKWHSQSEASRGPIYVWTVSFLYRYYTVQSVFTLEQQVKAKRLFIASLKSVKLKLERKPCHSVGSWPCEETADFRISHTAKYTCENKEKLSLCWLFIHFNSTWGWWKGFPSWVS